MDYKTIPGGVCAAKGFMASGIHCGIRKSRTKRDLALIIADTLCNTAGVYTANKVKASPLVLTMQHLKNGKSRAVLVNSGNANACAPNGMAHAEKSCALLAAALAINPEDVVVASTGVIGQELNIAAIEEGIAPLVSALSETGNDNAAEAIMTTDLLKKETAIEFSLGGKSARIGGMAKGSGMIHPNMGTMLSFVTTDCAIRSDLLQKALLESAKRTYNRVSVDGDTSTNDMCVVLASGHAGNREIDTEGEDFQIFCQALDIINTYMARMIAKDGEGATKLITATVSGAPDETTAELLAKSVVSSSLTKAAMFGADANWGRVLCAMGYSDASFDPEKVAVSFASAAGTVPVCDNGAALDFDEDAAKKILSESEITILIDLKSGSCSVDAWGCDLTYDYVKINGDYRT